MRSQLPQLEDFSFFHEVATRWSDMDVIGHVNNARFFSFDESARIAYFDAIINGMPGMWQQAGFILARISCDFISQLHHPSTVRVGYRIARIGRSSMDSEAGLFVAGKLVAATRGVLVWFDYQNSRALPVPPAVRMLIRDREKIAPDETA